MSYLMWTNAMAHEFGRAGRTGLAGTILLVFAAALVVPLQARQRSSDPAQGQGDGFKFKSGSELVNVTATVTDGSGRFASGLSKEDFNVYEDDVLQTVTHFGADRVPVSLGIV